jgi:predicted dehydrogenase/threonine dehydrogenase-like Zn-dependent dehydrogenase
MQQLTQKLGSGEMKVQEVPLPQLNNSSILVKNYYSLISAGTEGTTVNSARKSLLGKAKERPQQVKQVIDVLKQQGPIQTYRAVKKKLDAYSPLGYSTAGVVMEVGKNVKGFKVGDKVACAGIGYANHAEVNAVPQNLAVRLDDDADLKLASYNTLGAIALQGIRQADLRLGESCAVVGLGLLGQLTGQMLMAAGVNTYGIDVNPSIVAISKENGLPDSWERDTPGLEQLILQKTNGQGVDAVIITAGTSSLDPVNFAGNITRKKGNVIIVGAVPTGFDRAEYYKKELALKMSCSYGPGRYDLDYEEKGIDYPYAYVRWTENRNMSAFQDMIYKGRINIDYLSTHEFGFERAAQAYDMIVNKTEPYLGIVLKYDTSKEVQRKLITTNENKRGGEVCISFIGAGSYAQGSILPNIPVNNKKISNIGVYTNSGTTSKRVAEKFGFEFASDDNSSVLDERTNTVFITTRHDSHANYVMNSLELGKNVFVEKPLCLNIKELDSIKDLYHGGTSQLMVGFNRRFAPLAISLKNKMNTGPTSIIYRINAGSIPKESWIQDSTIGGGRIIGEVCHFIDFVTWISGSLPTKVQSFAIPDDNNFNDIVSINMQFANGSIASIQYFSNGSKALPKEYIEVYQSGLTGIIKDFKSLEIYGKTISRKKLINQDKGQSQMVKTFLINLAEGKPAPISFSEIYKVTLASFNVVESLISGETQIL